MARVIHLGPKDGVKVIRTPNAQGGVDVTVQVPRIRVRPRAQGEPKEKQNG